MALIAPPNAQYTFASPRRQLFSFPQDVIARMLKNPSSHIGLMKLYQTCKYFYAKRPILIADAVEFQIVENEEGNKAPRTMIKFPLGYADISHVQVPLWITTKVELFSFNDQRLPSFFRSSAKKIVFDVCDLHFDDFVLLAAEKNVTIFQCKIGSYLYHSDKSKVTIDQVLMHLPNIEEFWYCLDEKCSADSLVKLNEIKLKNKFKSLHLVIEDVHPTFDLNLFHQFIVKNCDAETDICLLLLLKAIEKLKVPLAKMDSKWRIEGYQWGFAKMALKEGRDAEEKKMEE